ncbi:MAG TPA: ABC transporter ATP-binding protein [Ktedonobacteraceae bacterium]|nr:ABC transporter ATP-binding protein [Ktedonobacteraceae bacterium]
MKKRTTSKQDNTNHTHPSGKATPAMPDTNGKKKTEKDKEEESFKLRHVFAAFASLPRVMGLVWSTDRALTLGMLLISILRGFLPAVSVSITRLLIDSVVKAIITHVTTMVWVFVALQLAANLADRLLSTLSNIVQQLLQEKVSNRVQLLILEKANTLDLAFFEDSEFYDKLRRASDEANYKPVQMISQTFDLLRSIITLFSMIALLLQLAWWLAALVLVLPLPSFIANSRYGWIGYYRMRRESPERRQMLYYNQVMTVDRYNKEIKLFNLGHYFIERFKHLAEKFFEESKKILIGRYLANFVWTSLSLVANAGIYIYVALQTVARRITLGQLTLYTQTAIQVGSSFQGVLDGISNTYENNLFVNTLFEFLEYQPVITSPSEPHPLVRDENRPGLEIEFRNVSFTYPGKDPGTQAALKNVSFTIHAGEAIALVGRNGAGKTTLVKLLTRLYDPDEGEILVGGRNIKDYDLKELRREIGVIFQDYVSYHLTARENIGIGNIEHVSDLERISGAAQQSGAHLVIQELEDGYETLLGRWWKDGTELSGGQWQKIALARAFMREARILTLDEPTSSLDAKAEYEVFAKFRELTRGKTAIFISHRFSTVRLADRIFVLDNGHIIETGSHIELMALDSIYAELFNLQAEAYR